MSRRRMRGTPPWRVLSLLIQIVKAVALIVVLFAE